MLRAAALRTCVAVVCLLTVSTVSEAQTLAGGYGHTVVLKSDGTVWAFGANNNGQLGDGTTTTPRKTPVQITALSNVVAVGGRRVPLAGAHQYGHALRMG